MCWDDWETKCKPSLELPGFEFHFSDYGICTFITPKRTLQLFSDLSKLFNLLHDHSAVTRRLD